MMRSLLLALLFVCGGIAAAPCQAQDSSATSSGGAPLVGDWLVIPYASYSPSTKISVGGGAGYYGSAPPGQAPSRVEVSMKVTQRGQISAELEPELYLDGGRWHVTAELRGSKYPNSFFGVGGDTPDTAEESFTARYADLDLIAQRRLRPNVHVGPRVFVRVEDITDPEANGLIENDRVVGADGGTTAGVGGAVLWDDRDNHYYPTTGTYAEVVSTWYSSVWGSDHTFGYLRTDLRGYQPAGPGVWAAQVYASGVAGRAPFLLLPTLGGDEQMRGYRSGRFRDQVFWSIQTEYRIPLVWRFKGAAFASAGEVGPRIGSPLFDDVEVAGGLGARLQLTDGGLHGRLDVAYSRTGIEVYISLGEAF